jgi:glycosyltransferase involved in cell wall biosynthesis
LKIPQDSFVLLFIGRKEKNKGIKELLQAWYIINERGYAQAYLLMLGPSTRLWHQLRAAGIPAEERFSDLGEVSEDIKALALEACDCLILPSKGESFGIVIQEAWASKRAVVVSTLGSTSTIVSHGIDGLLFEIGSSESIADSCVRLIEQPRMAREMGRRGFDKVMNRYSTPVVEKDIMEMYSRISMKFGGGG